VFDKTSRYRDVPVAAVAGDDGRVRPWVTLRISSEAVATVRYVVRTNDRVDLLANRAYGDPSLWWQVADANPEEVTDSPRGLVDEPGSQIDLPLPVRPEVMP